MKRLVHIFGSLAIVLVVYVVYALAVVPFIEPPVDSQQAVVSQQDKEKARNVPDRQLAALAGLFPDGAWELDNPKILESDRVKLLLRDYKNLGDGRVEIRPCTIIFCADKEIADPVERKRRSVILEAPHGALLEFDAPFDLRRAKVGRLVSGQLNGRITIRSQGKLPGPEDDLRVVTQDVQLSEKRIWTPHLVDFHLGPNYGSGRHMQIILSPTDEEEGMQRKSHGPNIGGIESFEVRQLDRLHLEFAKKGNSKKVESAGPVEITCCGPFRFDVVQKVATFEDRVNVLQSHANGPSDQITCERLSVFFDERQRAKPEDKGEQKKTASLDLQPQRIEARGNPVVVRAPSRDVHARGQRLEYSLADGRILLDGTEEVFLTQAENEIHARCLQYYPTEDGRLGRLLAYGPGWLRGQPQKRPDQQLEAFWNEMLQIRPDKKNQVISLTGGAELKFKGIGRMTAKEVHFWLLELPSSKKGQKTKIQPDRLLAQENVKINSPQLTGAVEQLEVWFEEDKEKNAKQTADARMQWYGNARPTAYRVNGGGAGALQAVQLAQKPGEWTARPPPIERPSGEVEPRNNETTRPASVENGPKLGSPLKPRSLLKSGSSSSQQHFQITGRLLQAKVTTYGKEAELTELIVEDDVRFAETKTAEPGQRPLIVRGDRLHIVDASAPHAAVTVTGRPAHFEGRGLGLTGSNINLNRGTNRLWIDGPGRMDLPMDKDLQGNPVEGGGPLEVRWQDRMEFDGRTALFEESVVATSQHQHVRTETLEVRFKRLVNFGEVDSKTEPEVLQLLCRGGVYMESHAFDERGQVSTERMNVCDLAINLDSGALSGGGPGWVTTVRRGGSGMESPFGKSAQVAPVSDGMGAADDNKLTYLAVRFQKALTGNVHQKELTFHGQVRTVYGPVATWFDKLEGDDPESLGPNGVLLNCDQLSVNEMPTLAGASEKAVELEASGNTLVEGQAFTARAARITYSQTKDMLVLEGNGRTEAELFRQKNLGGPVSKAAARKIFYWPSTNRITVDGARSLELSQFSSGPVGKR